MDGFDAGSVGTADGDGSLPSSRWRASARTRSPVVRLVNSTLYDALKLGASDIHLECDAGGLHVKYRIDGVLVPMRQVQRRRRWPSR